MQFLQIFIDIWNTAIIEPMINCLVLLYSVSFLNFGIAIIAFTLIVRIVLIPLTVRQSRQMLKMTQLQPQLKEIQERYKDDRQQLSRRTMEIYKENGVNPIGCLGPLFIQFPIWIGLFQAVIQTLPSTPERLVGLSERLYSVATRRERCHTRSTIHVPCGSTWRSRTGCRLCQCWLAFPCG